MIVTLEHLIVSAAVVAGASYLANESKEAIQDASKTVAADIRQSVKQPRVEVNSKTSQSHEEFKPSQYTVEFP